MMHKLNNPYCEGESTLSFISNEKVFHCNKGNKNKNAGSKYFRLSLVTVAVAESLLLLLVGDVSTAAPSMAASEGFVAQKVQSFQDTVDGTSGQTFYYLQGSTPEAEKKILTVTLSEQLPLLQFFKASYSLQYYIAGGYRGLPGGTSPDVRNDYLKALGGKLGTDLESGKQFMTIPKTGEKQYWITSNGAKNGQVLSSGTSGYTVNFIVKDGGTGTVKIYGGREDLFDASGNKKSLETLGASGKNTVNINFVVNENDAQKSGGTVMTRIVFGGRSAQMEGEIATEGFLTNNNKVYVQGQVLANKTGWVFSENLDLENYKPELISRAGVWGAEGYETSSNYVNVQDAVVTGATGDARKYGLVGGRGFFSYRLNTGEGMPESGISNNNIVVAKNTMIGLKNPYKAYSGEDLSSVIKDYEGQSFSVIGGYSPGVAKNNVVVLEDVRIDGNVYGAFELKNQLTSLDGFRNLDPNLVSLRNVYLEKGSSIYGTATGDTKIAVYVEGSNNNLPIVDWDAKATGQEFFDEREVIAVNRRRGVVDIAERVETDSVFARYVQFGQYIKTDIKPGEQLEVTSSYFPHVNKDQELIEDLDTTSALEINTKHIGYGEVGFIALGQQVAGSYVLSRKGFHSDMSPEKDGNGNYIQSESTLGAHNFWVGAYVNTVDRVEGDGTSFNTKQSLFKESGEVNHQYGSDGTETLSLLTHDDGMIYDFSDSEDVKHRPALMHHFRYHYQGLVLYTGVSDGEDGRAVQLSFDKIKDFRVATGQNTNAFGNTFVGIIKDGKVYSQGSVEEGFDMIETNRMVVDVPYSIYQSNAKVADATYSFYKYMHFDGSDEKFTDGDGQEVVGKVTPDGKPGGVGVKYWLKELNVLPGRILTLNGTKTGDVLEVENFYSEDKSKQKQELYTLSARISGEGGVAIAKETSVIIGSPKTIYTLDSVSEIKEDGNSAFTVNYSQPEPNTYTGLTAVSEGATLLLGIDGALGSSSSYTSDLILANRATAYLQRHTQTVGNLSVSENATLDFNNEGKIQNDATYVANLGATEGELTVNGDAKVSGKLIGSLNSHLIVNRGSAEISSSNEDYKGVLDLRTSHGYLLDSNALQNGLAKISKNSSLHFYNAWDTALARTGDPRNNANIRAIQNAGEVFLSGGGEVVSNLNHVYIAKAYEGQDGSVIHYRGLVQGPNNSYVDVVHSETASGTSKVSFGDDHSKIPVSGIFKEARGEKTIKSEGIPIFVIADKGAEGKQLQLEMEPFGVVAKDDEAYKWIYNLGYNDDENGGRTWVLYNSNGTEDNYQLIEEVLRPEAGAYVGASQSWGRMHMRLHDRFGQAYYIDPFDGEEKPAATWVRQVGSHSHFRMGGGQSKTHSNTAVTQIGGDLLRNEFNEDWKYIGGVFAGGLYNRSDSRSWDSAKSRSDGYSLGIYGTLYTGNSPDDGFYVDSWLLFGRYDNKIWSDEISPFKFKSHGWVWSVETGYTIPIGESGTKDYNKLIWTFQPEAQLVWDGVKANSANDSFGTKYRQLGTDNVTFRVGARLHANYMNKGLGFIEGNWIHNSKKAGVQMGTDKVYMDGGRNLGEFRMGLEGHLSRNTLGWATVGVQAGKSGYHNETAQIGIKYMF